MFYVYVIQNESSYEIYIGYTTDLKSRLVDHNAGETKSTKRRAGKWMFVYAEAYRTKSDAIARERRLKKHGSGKRELLKRLHSSLLRPKTGAGSAA